MLSEKVFHAGLWFSSKTQENPRLQRAVISALWWATLLSSWMSTTCVPSAHSPAPPLSSGLPSTLLAAEVEANLEAAGCSLEGGLPALEQLHANVDRPAWVDLDFAGDAGTVCPPSP